MKYAEIEKFCLSLPGVTLSIQWDRDHVYKVGDKMLAAMGPPICGRKRFRSGPATTASRS